MALTKAKVREILSAAGVEKENMAEAVEKIIDGHVDSINALREDVEKYKADAEKLPTVQKELDELKAKGDGGLQEKLDKKTAAFDALKKEFDAFKGEQAAKESRVAKETAVKAYLESKGINGDNVNIAMRGMNAEIDATELDGDKIKDSSAIDALLSGDFKGLVTTTSIQNAPPPVNPPSLGKSRLTREQIYAKDNNGRLIMSRSERQKAIAENLESFE